MNATDTKHLLNAIQSLRGARIEISRMTSAARDEISQSGMIDEMTKIEDAIGDKWLASKRAARALGSLGGSANTDLQNKARAENGRKFGGRKKGSKNKPKDKGEA